MSTNVTGVLETPRLGLYRPRPAPSVLRRIQGRQSVSLPPYTLGWELPPETSSASNAHDSERSQVRSTVRASRQEGRRVTDYCRNCGTARNVRRLEVQNPDGEVMVCEDCEDDLRATVVQVIEDLNPNDRSDSQPDYESVDALHAAFKSQFENHAGQLEEPALEHVDIEIAVEPERINVACEQPGDAPEFETRYGSVDPASLVHDVFVEAARSTGRRLETDLHMCELDRFVGHVPLEPNPREVST